MRLVIAGGGTGGHLFPALALAEEFKREDAAIEIVFIGASGGIEQTLVPQYGYEMRLLDVTAIKNRQGLNRIRALVKAAFATIKAAKALREIRPDGVIGTGSYSSGPVVLAAWFLGIKTAILEQNALPGLTNRILGKFVDRAYVAFDVAARYFSEATAVVSGTPVRRVLAESRSMKRARAGDKFNLLVFGGSQGATALNAAFIDATEHLTDIWSRLGVVHQTGYGGYGAAEAAYTRKGLDVEIYSFIDDMAGAYAAADLVVCRAGATTIAEITALGLPAILIPYPFSSDDHQQVNASYLVDRGAALMITQSELTGASLANLIRRLYEDKSELDRVVQAVRSLGRPDAAGIIVKDYTGLLAREL